MIHTIRTVAVGDQESKIDSPIILYRGDREVEVEFTINGSKFTFTNGGNVIKSTNATGNFRVILVESLPSDNFQYRGASLPTKAAYNTEDKDDHVNSTTNYSKENANKFVDITDIIGEYYVGILMTGRNVRASIKEIRILR